MLKKTKIFILAFFIIFSCSKSQVNTTPIEITPLLKSILTSHVSNIKPDDWFTPEFNAKVLDSFFTSLDQNKYFFYYSDILKFRNNPPDLRANFRTNSFPFIFEIFNDLYRVRHAEATKMALELVDAPHDFAIDESITFDRERINFANNEEELRERWRKYIKLQLLNHISVGRDLEEARDKVRRRLQRQAQRVIDTETEDIKARFINALFTTLDPHTNFLTVAENNQFLMSINLRLEGIGARLRSEDGFTIVESIISGSPASRLPPELELMPNDKIIAVAQGKAEPVDVIDYDLNEVVALIRGKKGTTVRLTILREVKGSTTPERLIIPIVRDRITLEDDAVRLTIKETESNGRQYRIG
jgi:carboxyl-terminal processing protease